jgi:outer membrane protein TolC
LQNRLAPALALSLYDWKFIVESGWQEDKSDSFSPFKDPNSKYQSYITTGTLQKPLLTGTLLGLEVNHLSQKADLPPVVNPLATPVPTDQTQNSVGITLEQALLGNFFGVADRATVNAANETYAANEIQRANALEDTVMSTITLYWDTYVAQENFKEALASRDRYTKLVETVRRKTSLGYSNPGELSQAEAGLQAKEQAVKSTSVDYLMKQENLITTLGLETGSEIDFVVSDAIPTVPKLPAIDTENLRNIRSQKLKVEAAQDGYTAAKSNSFPYVALVGKAYTTGSDQNSQTAYAETASATHPRYYVGVKVSYSFGSGYLTENVFNKAVTRDLEEARLYRERLEAKDQEGQAERKVESTYAIALSATKEREFRDKAVQELNRTYSQGRTDIKTFIDALNDFFTAEVALSRAVGDYQISLNQWASVRDELIPDQKQETK